MKLPKKTLEQSLDELIEVAGDKPMQMRDIINVLLGRGLPVILILFSFPFCLPIQIPGFSTPFGLSIAYIGINFMLNRQPHWPEWLLKKEFSAESLKKIVNKLRYWMEKIRGFTRPRMLEFSQSVMTKRVNGLFIFVLGILLALPLPIPFTNMVAAFPILFIGLGLLEDDGLMIMTGWFFTFCSLLFWLSLIMFGVAGYEAITHPPAS